MSEKAEEYRTLSEMRGLGLERLTLRRFCELAISKDFDELGLAPDVTARVDRYLSQFCVPDGKCPRCGRGLFGVFGTFQWGICSGEGMCGECGWLMRALHEVRSEDETARVLF